MLHPAPAVRLLYANGNSSEFVGSTLQSECPAHPYLRSAKDNNETALEVEQDILNSFRKNGFELISPRFNHMRNFLTCLTFMAHQQGFTEPLC